MQDIEADFNSTAVNADKKISPELGVQNGDTKEVIKHLEIYTKHLQGGDDQNKLAEEWKILSRVIDRIFFWITIVLLTIASIAIFVSMDDSAHLTDLSGLNLTDTPHGQGPLNNPGSGH